MNNSETTFAKLPLEEKAKSLKHIVNIVYELDLMESTRDREHVDARATFMKIMKDEGYSFTAIGKMLNKNHATIINALRDLDWIIENEKTFRKKYLEIKRLYHSNTSLLEMKTELELKNSIISLNNEINLLHLENIRLKKENELFKRSESRFSSLHKLVNERTKEKDVDVVYKKLNTIYNGL